MDSKIVNIIIKSLTIFCFILPLFALASGVNYIIKPGEELQLPDIKPKKTKKIVIDAGHGGHDSGAVGKNCYEKDLVLKMALKLGDMISAKYPEIEVLQTRTTDVFIPLFRRIQYANEENADLFISIHCNHIGNSKTRGTETFVMGLHRAEDNLAVAKRENASILLEYNYEQNYDGYDPNSPESHIILSMFQNSYLEKSINFAAKIENEFENMNFSKSRGVKQAGFAVLRRASMPAVLVEAGFLSNEMEEAFLISDDGQKKVCLAMLNAVGQFFQSNNEDVATNKKPEQKPTDVVTNIKPSTTPTSNKVNIKPETESLGFRVQIAALKSESADMDSAELRKIGKLHIVKQNEMNKYLVGDFKTNTEANIAKEKLRKLGYAGAFIVAK